MREVGSRDPGGGREVVGDQDYGLSAAHGGLACFSRSGVLVLFPSDSSRAMGGIVTYRQVGTVQVLDENDQPASLRLMEQVVGAAHHGDRFATIRGLKHLEAPNGERVQLVGQAYLSASGQIFRPV